MKILTNVQTSHLAGIGQAFWSLLKGLEKNYPKNAEVVGVRVISDKNVSQNGIFTHKRIKNFKLCSITDQNFPSFKDAVDQAKNLNDLITSYQPLIEGYQNLINRQSPDLILLNGTYYVPWCLYLAARTTKIPIILHYHGILSKEVSHWSQKPRLLMNDLENSFDNDRIFYLFPSSLARKTVENEVFKHKISKSAIIPNSVPDHFFKIKKTGDKENVGFVGRWSKIKNPMFIKKTVEYNNKKHGPYKINLVTSQTESKKEIKSRKNVVYHPQMNNFLLAGFYEKMGVLLSPSYFETYGNVAQEAIASGTPALISENMGVAETYRKLGLDNFIVDFKSVAKIYKKIGEISGSEIPQKTRNELKQIVSDNIISSEMMNVFNGM